MVATVQEGVSFKGRKISVTWKGERILGVREKSLALAGEPVDVTTDDDDGWRRLAVENGAAQDNVDLSVNGVLKTSMLREDWLKRDRSGALVVEYPTGQIISGTAQLVNYNETGNYKEAVTFEATFQFSGEVGYDFQFS